MQVEIAVVALIGASVSALNMYTSCTCIRVARCFFSGLFFAYFLGEDMVNVFQHVFSFKVSTGGTVFMCGFLGSALLERVLMIINAFTLKKWTIEK